MANYDDEWMTRDLVGYGPDRPAFAFPKGAKIAVNCTSKAPDIHKS